jgi:hypothetical protein
MEHRKQIEAGDRVKIVAMEDPGRQNQVGKKGVVLEIWDGGEDPTCSIKRDDGSRSVLPLKDVRYCRDQLTPNDIEFMYRLMRQCLANQLTLAHTLGTTETTHAEMVNQTEKLVTQIDQRLAGCL